MNTALIFKLLAQRRKLLSRHTWSREKILRYQRSRLRELRKFAYARSDFYKEFHRGLYDKGLEELPVLTKSMVMEHFESLVTDKYIRLQELQKFVSAQDADLYRKKYRVTVTSGTSGTAGIFLADENEWVHILASYARSTALGGIGPVMFKKTRMGMVSTAFRRHQSYLVGSSTQSPMFDTMRIDIADPLDDIVEKLNRYQPDALVSYSSMVALLADRQSGGDLKISPGAVFTTAEILTANMRNRIKEAWGREPFNQYTATESGMLGAECNQHHGMHLFDDQAIIEVVDENNRPVPPGVMGAALLITPLFSRTQPLIRYKLDDSIRISQKACSCGITFPLIEEIQGRTEQIVYLTSRQGKQVAVHPVLFYDVMDRAGAGNWQVRIKKGKFIFSITGNRAEGVDQAIVELMRAALLRMDVEPPAITVRHVDELARSSHKLMLITIDL